MLCGTFKRRSAAAFKEPRTADFHVMPHFLPSNKLGSKIFTWLKKFRFKNLENCALNDVCEFQETFVIFQDIGNMSGLNFSKKLEAVTNNIS